MKLIPFENTNWKALKFDYSLDENLQTNQIDVFPYQIPLNVDYNLYQPIDISINKSVLFYLLNTKNLDDLFQYNDSFFELKDLQVFSTSIQTSGGNYWQIENGKIITGSAKDFIFEIHVLNENELQIKHDNQFVSYDDNDDEFLLSDKDNNLYQTYRFISFNNQFTLFIENIDSGLLENNNTIVISSSSYEIFTFEEYETINNDVFNKDSAWYRYKTNIIENNNHVSVKIDEVSKELEYNFLLSTPFKNIVNENDLQVNVNNLKNYQTVNYNQFDDENKRVYQRLITGVNQEDGYEDIHLAFQGATQEILFEADRVTYFHFPPSATPINVNDSSLVIEGAIAGNTPYKADKIFKFQGDYDRYTYWGQSLENENGTWLCSWLSGSDNFNIQPKWMDRYYDPDHITFNEALSGNIKPSYFRDVVSQNTFDPGVLYAYHHFGETDNQKVVDSLRGDNLSNLVLFYEQWRGSLIDQSVYGHPFGSIIDYNIEKHLTQLSNGDEAVKLDGLIYGILPSLNDQSFVNEDVTVSFQIHQDDWGQAKNKQTILSNIENNSNGFEISLDNTELKFKFNFIQEITNDVVTYNTNIDFLNFKKGQHQITFTYQLKNKTIKIYIDSVLKRTIVLDHFHLANSLFENDIYLGTNNENKDSFNYLIGSFGDLRIYKIPLTYFDILSLYRRFLSFETLVWDIPTGDRNYIEQIKRFFKFKMPGNKSTAFNLKINNLGIDDEYTRNVVENNIRKVLPRIVPVNTVLNEIVWE